MKTVISTVRMFVAGLVMAVAVAGCKDKEGGVSFNPEFSINLMAVQDNWPGKKYKLKPREKAALEKYGRPDFMRIIWDRTGAIKIRDQFSAVERKRMKKAAELPTTWVYLDRNVELVFSGDTWQERRLNDEIKLVARMGDPEAVREIPGGIVEWTFYSTGRIVKLLNGSIVETRQFPAMPGFMK